jgi:hypothetical protein
MGWDGYVGSGRGTGKLDVEGGLEGRGRVRGSVMQLQSRNGTVTGYGVAGLRLMYFQGLGIQCRREGRITAGGLVWPFYR